MTTPQDSQTLTADLKPCPFCGGAADVRTYQDESLWSHSIVTKTQVGCNDCDYSFATEPGYEIEALELWNTRAPLPSPPVSGEAWTDEQISKLGPWQRIMDKGGLDWCRDYSKEGDGHDRAAINKNSLFRLVGLIDALMALSPLTNEPVWLGMTDAPRDGTAILGDVDGSAFVVWWDKMHSGWVSGHTDADDELYTRDVNGWMPLPTPQHGDSAAIGERG